MVVIFHGIPSRTGLWSLGVTTAGHQGMQMFAEQGANGKFSKGGMPSGGMASMDAFKHARSHLQSVH